jgi:hypothetical protein
MGKPKLGSVSLLNVRLHLAERLNGGIGGRSFNSHAPSHSAHEDGVAICRTRSSLARYLNSAAALGFFLFVHAGFAQTTLWYNGDFNGVNGEDDEMNAGIPDLNVYDDFFVPAGQSWTLSSIFSNDLATYNATTAYWEIRSGISSGNGGTLLASGTSAVTQTATGGSAFGESEYNFQVSGLNVALSSGTYWLTLSPIGSGSGSASICTTSGLNAIGTPPGNDWNTFRMAPDSEGISLPRAMTTLKE